MNDPCPAFLPALVDAAEGQLAPELETHLESCAACQAELSELTASLEVLAPPPSPEPGPWLAPKIRAHHEASAPRTRLLRWALPALVPVALIITVVWTGPAPEGHAGLTSLEALESELAGMDPTQIENILGESETDTLYRDSDDPLVALAAALAETDAEILDTVLAESSLGYEDDLFDRSVEVDDELELILEAIPG